MAILRPVAIVMLVVFHCFEPHIGDCRLPEAHQFIGIYRWLAEAAYACMLELFVFLSGFVFALAVQCKQPSLHDVMTKKAKRLLAPYLIFGILYFIPFYGFEGRSIWQAAYIILNGPGHLWFLLMLFEATVACWLLDRWNVSSRLKWTLVILLPLISFVPIPLRIGQTCYYIPLFYMGMQLFRTKDSVDYMSAGSGRMAAMLVLSGICVFISGTLLINGCLQPAISDTSNAIALRAICAYAKRLLHLAWSVQLVIGLFLWINRIIRKRHMSAPNWLININKLCFGVYVLHMFVIRWLYYYTDIPTLAGPVWLPWIGTVTALPASLLMCWLIRRTEIGRRLL